MHTIYQYYEYMTLELQYKNLFSAISGNLSNCHQMNLCTRELNHVIDKTAVLHYTYSHNA